MNWFVMALKKYAVFSGRSPRKEYWYFVLFYLLGFLLLAVIDNALGMYGAAAGVGVLSGIFSVALLLPSISVAARRLHDTGRSGWWQLILLVPFLGGLVLLAFLVRDGQPGANQHGPNPKMA